jgi:magnesium-transporting ATPase (P-type)
METSTLDGEKHLKQRESLESIRKKLNVTQLPDNSGNAGYMLTMDLNLKLFV